MGSARGSNSRSGSVAVPRETTCVPYELASRHSARARRVALKLVTTSGISFLMRTGPQARRRPPRAGYLH